jgi:hypothetical protein
VCRVFYRGLANLDAWRWCLISKRLCGVIPGISPQPFQRAGSVNIRYHNLMRALTSNYMPFIGASWSHSSRDDDFWRRWIFTACYKNVCSVISEHHESNLLTSTHNYYRYDDPSAEPVAVHRRSKATKQTAESSQEQFEDSTTQASRLENINRADLCVDG